MKRIFALLLAMALALSMNISAFAAEITTDNGTDKADVTGTYVAGEKKIVYSVDIVWSDLSFTYTSASNGTWDPTTHTYTGGSTEAGWGDQTGTITVTNHSNTGIAATATYAAEPLYKDATMTFSGTNVKENALTLGTADNGKGTEGAGKETSGSITVTPDGSLPENTDNVKIGAITVTITQATSINGSLDGDWNDTTIGF